jgi:hypothetical protein
VTDAPTDLPVADWYADPVTPGQQRWWSGVEWTGYVRAVPPPAPPVPQPVVVGGGVATYASDQTQAPARARRGFLDSPFEPAGTPRNRPGTLSLIFALLLLVVPWVPGVGVLLGVALGITAVVLGIVGIVHAGRIGGRRGTAITGLVIGAIGTLAIFNVLIASLMAR